MDKPFVIEFCGTVNSGKSCSILNLYDFFNKGGIEVGIAYDIHALTQKGIVLVEYSITEMQIYNYIKAKYGDVTEEDYFKLRQNYVSEYVAKIDYLVLLYTESQMALRREYASRLSLEKSSFVTLDRIEEFNTNLMELEHLYKHNGASGFIDTTHMEQRDVALKIVEDIMPILRKRYLCDFKKHYQVR